MFSIHHRARFGVFPLLAILLGPAAGCDKPSSTPKTFTVAGYVKVGTTPLTIGTVTFNPDAAKGNTLKESPSGMISQDGSFKLVTSGIEGAPLGWYKVTVTPMGMPKEMPAPGQPIPKGVPFNAKFQKPETSGLSFEVVEKPAAGAYDINLN